MDNIYRLFYVYVLIGLLVLIGCSTDKKEQKKYINSKADTIQSSDPDCVEFVALWSAGEIAEKLGKDKKWVFLNYTVDLWDLPPSDPRPGDIVGELRASSYARIINRTDNEYLVESPMTKVHGWLDKTHVKSVTKKTIKTKKLCN